MTDRLIDMLRRVFQPGAIRFMLDYYEMDEGCYEDYSKLYDELLATEPTAAKGYEIFIHNGTMLSTTQDRLVESIMVDGMHNGEIYAIDFMPRSQWLAMTFHLRKVDLTEEQIIAHVLNEMAWFGLDEAEVQNIGKGIKNSFDEVRDDMLRKLSTPAIRKDLN